MSIAPKPKPKPVGPSKTIFVELGLRHVRFIVHTDSVELETLSSGTDFATVLAYPLRDGATVVEYHEMRLPKGRKLEIVREWIEHRYDARKRDWVSRIIKTESREEEAPPEIEDELDDYCLL